MVKFEKVSVSEDFMIGELEILKTHHDKLRYKNNDELLDSEYIWTVRGSSKKTSCSSNDSWKTNRIQIEDKRLLKHKGDNKKNKKLTKLEK